MTYEYYCKDCDVTFEYQQSISDNPIEHCIYCHQASVEKLISASGFLLTGGGWFGHSHTKE